MLDAEGLIEKHRGKDILIDTNLLVLFLVGSVNRKRILNFKRTGSFSVEDYDLLLRLIGCFGKLIATPHVLAQVSDLTDLPGKELDLVRSRFKSLVDDITELSDTSREIVTDPAFTRLGLTDAAIAKVSARQILVLTDDLPLHLALQRRNMDAVNFNHIRMFGWRGK